MHKNIDKVAWLYIQDRKLLGVRSKGKIPFYTPGGKREEGETDLICLKRELQEELAIELQESTASFFGEYQAQAHGKPEGVCVVMQCYCGHFIGTMVPNSEVEEIGWLTSNDIDSDRTSPIDKIILKDLKNKNLVD